MSRKPDPRLPFGPVVDVLRRRVGASHQPDALGGVGADRIADRIGVTQRTVWRWVADGVPLWSADTIAVHLGYHPVELWPDLY